MPKLKSIWKGRRVAIQLLKCKFLNKRIPIRVQIQVTKYCNLKCPYCYAYNNNPDFNEPSLNQWKDIFDLLWKKGCRWINVLGGEPLLRKDIDQILTYLKKKGFYIEMATNGWFIKDHINALKKVDHLFLSIDGDEKTCDITRGKGTYKKIMEGIKLLRENNIKFRLHAVLTKYSRDSFHHMLELSKKFNAPINFSEPGVCGGKADFLLTEKEMIEFYHKVQEYKKKGHKISSPWCALEYIEKWPLEGRNMVTKEDPKEIKDKVYPCYMNHRNCFIDVDGSMYSCGRQWGKGLNIFKDGFDKCWEYMGNLPCYSCRNMGAIEQSLVLSMDIKAMINVFKSYLQ